MELHLFLLWHNGMKYKAFVREKLESFFDIKYETNLIWDEKTTLVKIQTLYDFTFEETINKKNECGYGEVYLFIVEDRSPIQKNYLTKYGIIPVNKHAQEVKEKLRNNFNNQNFIHGTMTDFEFNNDIQTCLELTKETFIDKLRKGKLISNDSFTF